MRLSSGVWWSRPRCGCLAARAGGRLHGCAGSTRDTASARVTATALPYPRRNRAGLRRCVPDVVPRNPAAWLLVVNTVSYPGLLHRHRAKGDPALKYVNLGSTGLRISRVCLGMMSFGNDSERPWVLGEDAAEPIVKAAVDGGITFFDTADIYSGGASEVATGRLLPKFLRRDQMVVATKA